MSRQDDLKSSQGGGAQRTKLSVAKNYEAKRVDKPAFISWNKEEKKNNVYHTPIEGILIGSANVCSAFDDNLGQNGGTYSSSYYFTNKDIVLFDNNGKVAVKGDKKSVEEWVLNNTTEKKLSVKKVLFLLTSIGLIAVKTNMTLYINDVKSHDKDIFLDYKMKLVPTMYDPESESISKESHGYLGKFAKRNPPCYANILQGEPITDEEWDQWIGKAHVEHFNKYKEEKMAGFQDDDSSKEVDQETDTQEQGNQPPPHTKADIPEDYDSAEDDLPF